MEKVVVQEYDVIINNKIDSYDEYFRQINNENRIFVITDKNVFSLYNHIFKDKTTRDVFWYVIKNGDDSKSYQNVLEISNFLLSNNFKRNDILVSFGGGVVSDLTGFIASIYMRGVNLVHIPTTLLSQIDSTVGGKTGINLSGFKNIIGTFYNPKKVIIETDYLKTLPQNEIINGLGELIKTGFLGSKNLLNLIETNPKCFFEPKVIKEAIEIKKDYVLKDYHDKRIRHALNLGHTFGHAIEAASNFKIGHGYAVLLGMIKSFEIGIKLNITNKELYKRFINILKTINFEFTDIKFDQYKDFLINDKKSFKDGVLIVLIEDIGKPKIISMPWEELYELAN